MMFSKKNAARSKKAQAIKKGKQGFEADNDSDSDFEGDSDEEMIVQRTPQNKTPKGKNSQCMSEKKVSFEIAGKKTPGKTPQKHTFIAKKQSTPGAKGMKGIKGVQKKESQAEEEEDDYLDLDDINMEDDDEGEEEEEQNQNKSHFKQQKNNAKTPKRNIDKSKKILTPKGDENRDLCSLFVGNLPKDVTVDELKALSPDIESVHISTRSYKKGMIAFLKFSSEAEAEANYETLQNQTIRGEPFRIDFVGKKSKNESFLSLRSRFNLREFFIGGLPLDATIADVVIHFPKAYRVSFNDSPVFRSVVICFETEEDAAEAFNLKAIEIKGQTLVLSYYKLGSGSKKKKRKSGKNKNNAGQSPTKKMKF